MNKTTSNNLLTLALVLGALSQTARAQNGVWTNLLNANWSAATNWNTGVIASGVDATADFSTINWPGAHTTTLDAPYTVGTLAFGAGGGSQSQYLVGNNTLTLQTSSTNPVINKISGSAVLIGVPLSSSQQVYWGMSGSGEMFLTNAANLFAGGIITSNSELAFTTNALGNVAGTVTIGLVPGQTQLGFTAVSPAAANTIPIVIANGIELRASRTVFNWHNGFSMNYQPMIFNGNINLNNAGGDLYVNNGPTITFGGVVSGGQFHLAANNLNITNANNTFTGGVNLGTSGTAGTLGVLNDGALGDPGNAIAFTTASTLRADGSFTNSRTVSLPSSGTVNVTTNKVELDGLITGTAGLTVSGTPPGQLVLTGNSYFLGGLTVSGSPNLCLYGGGLLSAPTISAVPTNAVVQISDSFNVPNIINYTVNAGGLLILSNSCTLNSLANFTINGFVKPGGTVVGKLDASALSSPLSLGGILAGGGVVFGAVHANSGSTISGTNLTINGAVTAQSGSTIIPGSVGTAGTLTINNNLALNGQQISFDLGNVTTEGSGVNDELVVAGNLTLSGGEQISLNYLTGSLVAGTYKLIKYTGMLTGAFSLDRTYPNVTLDNGVTTAGYITLIVGSGGSVPSSVFWLGDGGANLWDVNTSDNWVAAIGGTPVTYLDFDKVIFNNLGSNNVVVNLNSTAAPYNVTFDVTNKQYTLTGSGQISGLGTVAVYGGGIVTNALANTYSGGTTISNNSQVVFLDGSSLGSGNVNIDQAAAGVQVIFNNSGTLNVQNNFKGAGGTPQVRQDGPGLTILGGNGANSDNAYLGAVVNKGILQLAKPNSALGHALGGPTVVNTGGTLQLGGGGGDQIYSGVTVQMAGGTFDTAGLSEGFTGLTGYGSVVSSSGTGTLTLTATAGISLSTAGTLGVTNANITCSGADTLNNPGTYVQEGGKLSLIANNYFGTGTVGQQNIVIDGGMTTPGSGETIWGENGSGTTLTTFGPNANCTIWYLSFNNNYANTNWYNGGTINFIRFNYRGNNSGPAVSTHYFNGSYFVARASDPKFMNSGNGAWVNYFISTNGFFLNSSNFTLNATLAHLAHDPALGSAPDGGLTKFGTGTLDISGGNNSFSGPITNNGGTIVLQNTGSYSSVVMGDNTALQINVSNNVTSTSLTNGSLSMGLTAGTATNNTLIFDLGTLGNPTVPLLQVNGVLTNTGFVSVVLAGNLSPGMVPLVKYGSMSANNYNSTWSTVTNPSFTVTLTNDAVNKLISANVHLNVTNLWVGSHSSEWDTATLNWTTNNGVGSTAYVEAAPPGEPCFFDDTALTHTVDISTMEVNPAFISMTNNQDYTFTGTKGVGGIASLLKSGSGALILANAINTNSGVTVINGGSVMAAAVNVLSSNSTMTLNNSSLNIGTNNQVVGNCTFNNSTLIGTGIMSSLLSPLANASLNFNDGASSFTLPALGGNISVFQNGTGTISLVGSNNFSGQKQVTAGTLRVTSLGALGTGGYSAQTFAVISSGAALVFDGASGPSTELININGAGPTGGGSLVVTNGSILLSQACELDGPSTIDIGLGSSLTNTLNFENNGPMIKTGGGLLYFETDGNTIGGFDVYVDQGTVIITTANSGNIYISSGGTFGGTATVAKCVTVSAGGTLAPGNLGIGTLTVQDSLTNSGNIQMKLGNGGVQANDEVVVGTNLVYGGTLTVTNVGPYALINHSSFKLFSAPSYANGSFSSVMLQNVPGFAWTNGLAVDGTIGINYTNSLVPTNIIYSISGLNLTLEWPADHVGWQLQVQTNNLANGVSSSPADWGIYPNSGFANSIVIPMNTTNPAEFFRLVSP